MNKTILAALLCTVGIGSASADITVNVAPEVATKDFQVEYGYISDMIKPRKERPEPLKADLSVTDGKFTIPTLPDGAAQYVIPTGGRSYIMIYTMPDENLTVQINSVSPLRYTVTGSALMEDLSMLDSQSDALMARFSELSRAEKPDVDQIKQLEKDYADLFKGFIAAKPDAAAVPYAILHLDGQDFLDAYAAMSPGAAASPIAPMLAPQKEYVERRMAVEKRKAEMTSGSFQAPDFTLDNMEGKPVSLADFRGKWVILDFWGSWCPWCIKGFPALKEAYAKHKDSLEVIGVDCNDPVDKWKSAVSKYQLPWIQVYNPEDTGKKILEDYAVEGFPTKVIIDPEGKIKNITSGEDPEFFTILDELLKK